MTTSLRLGPRRHLAAGLGRGLRVRDDHVELALARRSYVVAPEQVSTDALSVRLEASRVAQRRHIAVPPSLSRASAIRPQPRQRRDRSDCCGTRWKNAASQRRTRGARIGVRSCSCGLCDATLPPPVPCTRRCSVDDHPLARALPSIRPRPHDRRDTTAQSTSRSPARTLQCSSVPIQTRAWARSFEDLASPPRHELLTYPLPLRVPAVGRSFASGISTPIIAPARGCPSATRVVGTSF